MQWVEKDQKKQDVAKVKGSCAKLMTDTKFFFPHMISIGFFYGNFIFITFDDIMIILKFQLFRNTLLFRIIYAIPVV